MTKPAPNAITDKDSLLALVQRDLPKEIQVADHTFYVRKLSLKEAADWAASRSAVEDDSAAQMVSLLAVALANPIGARLLTDAEAKEIIPSIPAHVVAQLFNEAIDHSGMSKAAQAANLGNSDAAATSSS